MQYIYCKYTTIKLTEDGLLIKTGWLNKLTTLMPLEKIQDLYFQKGPFDRLLGTATLKAVSGETAIAGNQKNMPPNAIRGLDLLDAIELRGILLKTLLGKLPEDEEIMGDRSNYPLSGSSPIAWTVPRVLFFIPIFLFSLFMMVADANSPIGYILLAASIVILALIVVLSFEFFKTISYAFTKTAFVIQRGVIQIDTVTIPVKNIQDVYVNQGLIDRLFGLYSVEMSTISMESKTYLKFSSFSQQDANNLRNLISKIISKK
jgi:membrane protein YdbS with pleckstrin-like domain